MNHPRQQQRAGSLSDRSLAASTRRSAPSSVASRHLLPQEGEGSFHNPISGRRRSLSSIVLQLQPRYRKCVHFGEGAYIEVENVRTTSLRTRGAYFRGSDVRTGNFAATANLLQLAPAERHGGRSLQKAISVPQCATGPRRAAGMSRPLRRAGDSRRYSRSDRRELHEHVEQT